MKILITGGGGFLGTQLVHDLIERGYKDITIMGRSDYPHLKNLGVNFYKGDITSLADCQNACIGKEVIFHVASKVGIWGDYQDYFNTNVTGTNNLIESATKHAIKYFIYTSTPSVVFGKESIEGADESMPYPKTFLTHYGKTKAIAEKIVLDANNKAGMQTAGIRPHLILGKGDPNLIPRILDKAKNRKLIQIGDGHNLVDIIHVKNASLAHILLLEGLMKNPEIGGISYFVGQERPVNLWDFLGDVVKKYNLPPIEKKISEKKALLIGGLIEKFYQLMGIKKEPPITRFMVKQMAKGHYFSHSKAQNSFGYIPLKKIEDILSEI